MKVRIPNLERKEKYIENKSSIVLIGANGAGKTRMSIWIDENNAELNIHRISAQKSLNLPQSVKPTEMQMAEEELLYGTTSDDKSWLKEYGKRSSRWGSSPETYLLNDYEKLMQYLMTENYEKSIEYREKHKNGDVRFDNGTKLEKIKEIWENIILHRKMKICAGKVEVSNCDMKDYYNGSEMSDGERAIFYFVGEVLCAKENSLIIIDEPENHLHKLIIEKLWNAIEASRSDCTFLYITHDLDFAKSRVNSQIIWVQEYLEKNSWKYDLLDNANTSDGLKLEIMGSRQKVLLVEGTSSESIDKKLYSKIYPEYDILPMGSCNAVIQTTQSCNSTNDLHYIEAKGIIDRDRRDDKEVLRLREKGVFVLDVSEIENLFLLEDVIRIVAEKQDKEEMKEEIVTEVQEKTFEFLNKEIQKQALLFTQQTSLNSIIQKANNQVETIEDYKSNMVNLVSQDEIQNVYEQQLERMKRIIADKDYNMALKVINSKELLPYTKLPDKFGWKKKNYYIDYILLLLGKNNEVGDRLKQIFREHIGLDVAISLDSDTSCVSTK